MKSILLLLTLGLFLLNVGFLMGQEKHGFPIDEFHVSANRTQLPAYNTESQFGFGAGFYHRFLKDTDEALIASLLRLIAKSNGQLR